ncbi:MAG TPA: LysR family transcriptional regulator [Burkholderiales bacterium]|nr:LysR family transcriptional regulator [Burkholderiales bacterium]
MSAFNDIMFHDLQIFSAVVGVRSYKNAAQKLGIDLSNIGRRIKILEEQLACQLVVRNKQSIAITPEGMRLYQAFIKHDRAFNEMLDKFQNNLGNEGGDIDIAIPSGIIEYILAKKIPQYLKQNPKININLISQTREMNLVAEKYDFAILRHVPQQNALKIRKIYEIKIQLYCTKEYKDRYGVPEKLNDLDNHMLLGRIQDDLTKIRYYQVYSKTEHSAALHINTRFMTNNVGLDKQAVMSNEVIVGGNDYLYQEELATGKIIKVLPEYYFQSDFQSFYLVSDGNKHRRKIVQDFINYIINIFEEVSRASD